MQHFVVLDKLKPQLGTLWAICHSVKAQGGDKYIKIVVQTKRVTKKTISCRFNTGHENWMSKETGKNRHLNT